MLSTDTLSFSAYTTPTVAYLKTLWNCLQILMSYCLIINRSREYFQNTHTYIPSRGSVFFYFAISLPAKVHSHCRLRENSHSHGVEECIPRGTSVTHSSKATQATYNPQTFSLFLTREKTDAEKKLEQLFHKHVHTSHSSWHLRGAGLHRSKPTQVQKHVLFVDGVNKNNYDGADYGFDPGRAGILVNSPVRGGTSQVLSRDLWSWFWPCPALIWGEQDSISPKKHPLQLPTVFTAAPHQTVIKCHLYSLWCEAISISQAVKWCLNRLLPGSVKKKMVQILPEGAQVSF